MPKKTTPAPAKTTQVKKPDKAKVLRPIHYPDVRVNGVVIPAANLKVTAEMVRQWMGGEAEDEYIAAAIKKDPGLTPAQNDLKANLARRSILLTDQQVPPQRVRCEFNATNRDFH